MPCGLGDHQPYGIPVLTTVLLLAIAFGFGSGLI